MVTEIPLLSLIDRHAETLSTSQRRIARHIRAEYQAAAFATAAELAKTCRVSEATVVRFANALGFPGYPALQKEIRRAVRADLKGTDRFRLTDANGPGTPDPLAAIVAKELENIAQLRETVDAGALGQAAAALRAASRILIVGARATASLAGHLWFALDKLRLPVARALATDGEAVDRLGRMGPEDCVVVIGFPRYLRGLVSLLDMAKARGTKRIVVTDSPFSALRGDIALHAPAESTSFVAYHAAPLILLNALIEAVAAADRPATLGALQAFESLAEDAAYFHPA